MKTMDELLEDMVKDLYNAEKQLTKALPKMAKNASTRELKNALETHLKETEEQIKKLEQVCEMLDIEPQGKVCQAMQGLIEESEEMVGEFDQGPVLDAGIIGNAQKVEHYEIAGYGTARTIADLLGHKQVSKTLEGILDQEKATDEKLNRIAKQHVNMEAKKTSDGGEGGKATMR
jgi:ferritin-like metal-binding protein YciE